MRRVAEQLISIEHARRRVLAAVRPPDAEPVAIAQALGRVLAGELRAQGDVPPFANSAMDGYALRAGPANRSLRVIGESRAGLPADETVGEGEAMRISTGAAVPAGASAVARIEDTSERDGSVRVAVTVHEGENVRPAGDDVRAGTTLLRPGAILGPGELGVAVSAGVAEILCARRPRVAVLCTGDELRAPGEPLGPGEIHNTNAVTLAAMAERAGAEVPLADRIADDRGTTERALAHALDTVDVLVVSGGVSVGPHDHVKPALATLDVVQDFWGVALQPGKPTWFGTRGERLVFGLPGNPVSSLVTFALFVTPVLRAQQGALPPATRDSAVLEEAVARVRGREQAVRVRLQRGGDGLRATPTGDQGSHRLTSMLGADGLAFVPAGAGELAAGETVSVERW